MAGRESSPQGLDSREPVRACTGRATQEMRRTRISSQTLSAAAFSADGRRRWLILDRDGVINHDRAAYVRSPADWHPIAGALAAIARLHRAGFGLAVATNQSGVGGAISTCRR
jgi:Histidinol phosphatase and related phosphatases